MILNLLDIGENLPEDTIHVNIIVRVCVQHAIR